MLGACAAPSACCPRSPWSCSPAAARRRRTIGPSGVDGLTIPTPTPDPADFVDVVDNPWLPLVADSVWTYAVVGAGPARTVTVARVGAGPGGRGGDHHRGDHDRDHPGRPDARHRVGMVRPGHGRATSGSSRESGTTYAGGRVVPVGDLVGRGGRCPGRAGHGGGAPRRATATSAPTRRVSRRTGPACCR